MNTKQLSRIYTDGSCLKNPNGPGGWAYVVVRENVEIIGYGSNSTTTNNRMELQAIIEALLSVEKGEYELYTDSQWALKCATGVWRRKANLDLWIEFENVSKDLKLHWYWVKSHNDNEYNNLVDELAREEARKLASEIFTTKK